MTQVKLGEMLNYGYTAIANYESGRNQPSIPDLKKIASIFNIEGEGSIVVTTANGTATIVDEAGALPESSDESKDIRFN